MTELPLLIRVSGRDRPRLTRDLLRLLADAGSVLEDMEQLVVRERLTLDVLVRLAAADDGLIRDVLYWGFTHGLKIDFERVEARSRRAQLTRHAVTVLGRDAAAGLAGRGRRRDRRDRRKHRSDRPAGHRSGDRVRPGGDRRRCRRDAPVAGAGRS